MAATTRQESKADTRFYAVMALIDTLSPAQQSDIREALTNPTRERKRK
jgi:hypothetical protein